MFCWYFKHLNAFLAQCGYCVGKWKIVGIIDEGVNNETEFFYNFGIFIVKMLMKHGICLNGLLGIRLSLKRLVAFLDIYFMFHVHSMLNRTVLLCGVTCVILLLIMLVHVRIMHTVLILICLYL